MQIHASETIAYFAHHRNQFERLCSLFEDLGSRLSDSPNNEEIALVPFACGLNSLLLAMFAPFQGKHQQPLPPHLISELSRVLKTCADILGKSLCGSSEALQAIYGSVASLVHLLATVTCAPQGRNLRQSWSSSIRLSFFFYILWKQICGLSQPTPRK